MDDQMNGAPASRLLLNVEGLSKRFGGTEALRSVAFGVEQGQIHALLGENGAGKSTLIKILAGIHVPDQGSLAGPDGVAVAGRPVPGVAFVHQDLGLVATASVAENVAFGPGFAKRGAFIDWRRTRERARSALAAIGLDIDPETIVGRLASAEKSLVAIARALAVDARLIVLDEPTATLPQPDVERLHRGLLRLRGQGYGIVYVTHRLDEVFRIADQVTVLRDGAVRFTGPVASCTPAELVEHIVGRCMSQMFPQLQPAGALPRLAVKGLRSKYVGPVDFTLHQGEILGLVGLRNSGQDVVGRMIAGDVPARAGSIDVEGTELRLASPQRAIRAGVGFISSKRVEESIGLSLNLRENLHFDPRLAGLSAINTGEENRRAGTVLKRFDVRPPDPSRTIATLSGGNQQKVVVARWLGIGRKVLVLEEPTIGVDVGARAEIYRLLAQAAAAGLAILVVSSDFEEVCGICHRALVFGRGRPVAEIAGADLTVSKIAQLASLEAA
jgi:ribose transport system ATP-binding protein